VGAAGCAGLGVPFPSGPYGDYAPAWSPDGLEIAFSGLRTDGGLGYVLYVTDLSGNVVQLATEQGESPSWSPDGGSIAFGPDGLRRVGRSTGVVTELIADSTVTHAAWSPDGQTIAFATRASGMAPSQIYTLDVATSAITRLTEPGTPSERPAWSPDGSQIVFTSPDAFGFQQVRRMETDGSGIETLTDHPSAAREPVWCGGSIAYSAFTQDLRFSIHVMESDGSNVRVVTDGQADDEEPSWSPDCSQIAFSSNRESSGGEPVYTLWIVNADGSGLRKLTSR
jgi:TolB protein